MRIEASTVSMSSTSDYIEKNTNEEYLNTWVGSQGPGSGQPTQPESAAGQSGGLTSPQTGNDPSGAIQRLEAGRNDVLQALRSQLSDILDISDEGRAALLKMKSLSASVVDGSDTVIGLSDKDKLKIYALQKFLEALTGKKLKFLAPITINHNSGVLHPEKLVLSQLKLHPADPALFNTHQLQIRQPVGWGLEYSHTEEHYEKQSVSFNAQATVHTADGRQIDIDMALNMSREFYSRSDLSIQAGDAIKVDPLVINFDAPAAALTERKFGFDIDSDGSSEQLSYLKSGSGYLALDLNNDGRVNDGSELFGPQSGNGFAELAKYDSDSNGWIDENDSIYDKLRIWTKDEDGNDRLLALGQKGIGAIYLGSVKTDFDLKGSQNKALGDISSTGIFLREDGTAGTIQHIDLTI